MATQRSPCNRVTGFARLQNGEQKRKSGQPQRFAEQDKKRREQAETLGEADVVCYQDERPLGGVRSALT